ncbi:MAG: mechanosensitive ion channel family protein [Chloroflexi bacterium]|nr:mechanosensitive ion channel family protein [Chloroflexota bacterium]
MLEWIRALRLSPLLPVTLRIGLVLLLALLARRALRLAARRVERVLDRAGGDAGRAARLKTFAGAGRAAFNVLILFVAGLTVLYLLDINVAPLLAGAGVVGLAISLGAQTLIKDYLAGLLLLIEDQFRVGDVIQVGEHSGAVERITLRVTSLRDLEGKLHHIPNGEIRVMSNATRDWARAVVDLTVAFDADFGVVVRALEGAAEQARADEALRADLLEAPQTSGWVGLSDWGVKVRLMVRTTPGQQWQVASALRRYALEAMRREGVPVALPAQEIHVTPTP